MADPHVIRLRGPWELELLERSAGGPFAAIGRVQVPCDWSDVLPHDFAGRVRLSRRFNRPTNLEPHERVWLAIDPVGYSATIGLNRHQIGRLATTAGLSRFDVTDQLELHNRLTIEILLESADRPRGSVGEMRLEIE